MLANRNPVLLPFCALKVCQQTPLNRQHVITTANLSCVPIADQQMRYHTVREYICASADRSWQFCSLSFSSHCSPGAMSPEICWAGKLAIDQPNAVQWSSRPCPICQIYGSTADFIPATHNTSDWQPWRGRRHPRGEVHLHQASGRSS